MAARGERFVLVNHQAREPEESGLNPEQWHGVGLIRSVNNIRDAMNIYHHQKFNDKETSA